MLAKHIFHPFMPDLIIGQRVVGGVEVVTLLAIPFFVFASDLMARGRMAAQLADLFRALVGHYRGGIGHSTVVTCMVFGAAAGSAPATVAAMGRLSYPELAPRRLLGQVQPRPDRVERRMRAADPAVDHLRGL